MIRSNTREAREEVRKFVMRNCRGLENYGIIATSWGVVCRSILEIAEREIGMGQMAFEEWCQGLPSALSTDAIYLDSAVSLIGEWLRENEEEKKRFSEERAEHLAVGLIYNELKKGAKK